MSCRARTFVSPPEWHLKFESIKKGSHQTIFSTFNLSGDDVRLPIYHRNTEIMLIISNAAKFSPLIHSRFCLGHSRAVKIHHAYQPMVKNCSYIRFYFFGRYSFKNAIDIPSSKARQRLSPLLESHQKQNMHAREDTTMCLKLTSKLIMCVSSIMWPSSSQTLHLLFSF